MANTIHIFEFGIYGTSNKSNPRLTKCNKCGEKFYFGELIVSKPTGNARKKRYHKKCAEVCNII